ncbi:MAG: serine--tRNA ligase [Flavobacteriales bacterium]|nr:serine--tRNA ligase [Flavobacteriales bacterium]
MLDVRFVRENKEEIISRLDKRNLPAQELVTQMLQLDDIRREAQQQCDATQAEMNNLSAQIGEFFKTGRQAEANELKARTVELKETVKTLEEKQKTAEQNLTELLYTIPNSPHASVPKGKSAEDNEIVRESGAKPDLGSDALPHWEIAAKYNLINFELGVKITGAGFPVYIGQGAKLQRALIQFFLDEAEKAGYTEYQVPHMVNADSGFGTGQLPDKEGQMYHDATDDLYLIPTAEVPLTNLYRDIILTEKDFPIKMTGYTPCFRREAGSYGKDVRGLNRLHQFDKVEIVQIAHPDTSYENLETMVAHVGGILDKLELPYRILRLCGGDMGFASALTYDFETWSAAQQRWLEVSSTSNFETFQANRLKLRFKDANGKTRLCHTLNGSALALPRIVATLLENNQTPEGIRIPKCLVPYTGFEYIR